MIRKILITIALSYVSARLFLSISDRIALVYAYTQISKILPLWLVLSGMWLFFLAVVVCVGMALRNFDIAVKALIVYLPMSALPSIILGYPLAWINFNFMSRSSVVVGVFLLSLIWMGIGALSSADKRIRLPMLVPVVTLILVYVFNIFRVPDEQRMGAVQSCVVILSCGCFFYFMNSYVSDQDRFFSMLYLLIFSCCLQIVLSVLSFYYYLVVKHMKDLRVEGLLRDYELFADYLALHIPLFVFALRHQHRQKIRIVLQFFLLAAFMILLSTQTRGAIVALAAGMTYYFWEMRGIVKWPSLLRMFVLGAVMVVGAFLFLWAAVPESAKILERFQMMDMHSLDTRQVVWMSFVDYFRRDPVLGNGMVYDLNRFLFYPHSLYLYYLLTMGVVGFLAFVLVAGCVVRRALWNVSRLRVHPKLYEGAVVLVSMLFILLIDGIKIEYTRYSNYHLFVWLIFGLIYAMGRLKISNVTQTKG